MKIQRLREICCVGLPQLLPLRMNEIRFFKKTYINIYIHILLKKKNLFSHVKQTEYGKDFFLSQ